MLPRASDTRASLLVRLPNAADSTAWGEFVEIYSPLIRRLAQKQGLSVTDAEDLTQDVFAVVADQIQGWLNRRDRGPFRAWLLRVARNRAINILTRRPIGGVAIGGSRTHGLSQVEDPGFDFSSQFDIEYQRAVFIWAARKVRVSLAETTWQAFQLTHLDGVPIPIAANRLGISISAVYIARSRVMSRLKKLTQQFSLQNDAPKIEEPTDDSV